MPAAWYDPIGQPNCPVAGVLDGHLHRLCRHADGLGRERGRDPVAGGEAVAAERLAAVGADAREAAGAVHRLERLDLAAAASTTLVEPSSRSARHLGRVGVRDEPRLAVAEHSDGAARFAGRDAGQPALLLLVGARELEREAGGGVRQNGTGASA